MKIDWSFPRQVAITLGVLGAAGSYPLALYGTDEIIKAVVIGAILSTINVLFGYAAIEYSLGKSTTTFLKFVLGGMGVRMFMMAGMLVVLIKLFEVHAGALVGSMGACYVVFLTLEIIFIQKSISIKHHS